MKAKLYLKEQYREMPPKPFTGLDYLLCAIAYVLIGVAAVPGIASLLFGR
jgi:hypothetical protein